MYLTADGIGGVSMEKKNRKQTNQRENQNHTLDKASPQTTNSKGQAKKNNQRDDQNITSKLVRHGRSGKAFTREAIVSIYRTYMRQDLWTVLLAVVFIGISQYAMTYGTSLLKPIINSTIALMGKEAGNQATGGALGFLIGKMALFMLTSAFLDFYTARTMSKFSTRVSYRMREGLFKQIQQMPLSFYDEYKPGEVMSSFTNDIFNIADALQEPLPNTISSLFFIIITIIFMLILSPIMTLIMLSMMGLFVLLVVRLGKASAKNFSASQAGLADLTAYITEYLQGQKVIKNFNQEAKIQEGMDGYIKRYAKERHQATAAATIIFPISRIMTILIFAAMAVIGSIFIIKQKFGMDIGTLVTTLQYTNSFTGPVMNMAGQIQTIIMALTSIQRIYNYLIQSPEQDLGRILAVQANTPALSGASFTSSASPDSSASIESTDSSAATPSAPASRLNKGRRYWMIKKTDLEALDRDLKEKESKSGFVVTQWEKQRQELNQLRQLFKEADDPAYRDDLLAPPTIFNHLSLESKIGNQETVDDPQSYLFAPLEGKVEFQNVSFAYQDDDYVLRHLSFVAEPGRRVAFVGKTGSGKTTVVKLLARYYEISEGEIFLDGINTKLIAKPSLRGQIGMVSQEQHMFSGTIADNIAYGRLNASQEDIEAAASLVGADYFIRRLDDGYQTHISSDESMALSRGQMQLISIARADIKNPSILVLDEATSSVDTLTEQKIGKAMDEMMKQRTVIAIAHRLSTVMDSHEIIYLDEGQVCERGNHDTLMALQGKYYLLNRGAVIE